MYRIKLSGIYKITHIPTEQYYIGMSVDIYGRWSSHYSDIKLSKHTSVEFSKLFLTTPITDWKWEILEVVSKTELKKELKLKGKQFDNKLRTILLQKERIHMGKHSITFSLNKDKKYYQK